MLWLVFRKLDPNVVLEEIRHARYQWLILSILFGIMSHIARAIRWNILIRSMGYETRTSTTFYAVMVGYFANTAFPRLGEVTRCGVLSKKTNVPFTALFGTVISERLFDFIVLVLIILGVIFFQLDFIRDFVDKYFLSNLSGMASSANIFIAVVAVLLIFGMPLVLYFMFARQIRGMTIYQKLSDFIRGLIEGVRTIQRIRQKWSFLLLTLIIWVLYSMMTYVAFFALTDTAHLTFLDGVTVMAIGSLGIVAPVPGGIGAYQFIVKAILVEVYGVASEPAASYSIIAWAAQILMIVIVGILSYYILVFKKSTLNHDNAGSNPSQDI